MINYKLYTIFILFITFVCYIYSVHGVYRDIEWDKIIPSSTGKELRVPRGCKCNEDYSSNEVCGSFDCDCSCDLTAGKCDANCCCDSECSEEYAKKVHEKGLCAPEGKKEAQIRFCDADLVAFNSRYGLKEDSQNPMSELLCVVKTNNEAIGSYYTELTSSDIKSDLIYQSYALKAVSFDTETNSTYRHGSYIKAAVRVEVDSSSENHDAFGGYLPLASPIISKECSDTVYAMFGVDQTQDTCIRRVSSLSTGCATTLSAKTYVDNLRIGKKPNAGPTNAGDFVTVTIGTAKEYDPSTGEITDIASGSEPSYLQTGEYDSTSGLCQGILYQLEYVVSSTSGIITSVVANIVIGNYASKSGEVAIEQHFSVKYNIDNSVPQQESLFNTSYPVSGNPGYQVGLPLRVGKYVSKNVGSSSVTVVSELEGGLQIMAAGACSSSKTVSVMFGEDIMTGCDMSLTEAQLKTYCSTYAVPPQINLPSTRIATYGNSDPYQQSEWIELTEVAKPEESTATYTSSRGLCDNIITAVDVTIFISKTGPTLNPQNKIIKAQAKYSRSSWKFHLGSSQTSQNFFLSSSVKFVFLSGQDSEDYVPPTPPVWFSVPEDIFYPFVSSGVRYAIEYSVLSMSLLALYVTLFN